MNLPQTHQKVVHLVVPRVAPRAVVSVVRWAVVLVVPTAVQ